MTTALSFQPSPFSFQPADLRFKRHLRYKAPAVGGFDELMKRIAVSQAFVKEEHEAS